MGQYLGVAGSLSVSWLIGTGLPFLLYGVFGSPSAGNFLMLALIGVALSFIFSALAFLIALNNENRIKGFGLAIVLWLFFAVVYDGFLLLALSYFKEYPLEKFSLAASMFNPIDLSRILILLKLDISALMGFTGAVFRKFIGTGTGMGLAIAVLAAWAILPAWGIGKMAARKDF
jgi:Cu-processing system permease protein